MSRITTPEFRVSFPKVFKPELNKLNNKQEFSVVALFPKNADLSALKKAAQEALIEEFGPDKSKWPKNLRSPFRDQGEKVKTDEQTGKEILPPAHEKGAVFMNLKTTQRPGVVDQNVQPILDETQFYAGCYARAQVRVYTYNQAGNAGVNFGLEHLQKTRDGEPLGGRMRAEDAFSPVEGAATGEAKSAVDLFG